MSAYQHFIIFALWLRSSNWTGLQWAIVQVDLHLVHIRSVFCSWSIYFWNLKWNRCTASNPNNFFKQNVFNEKLNITKNPFTWHLGDPCRAQLFDIFPISLNDGLYSRSEFLFARCNIALSMPTNAASLIVVLNNIILGCRDLFVTLSIMLHVIIQGI